MSKIYAQAAIKIGKKEPASQTNFPEFYISKGMEALKHKTKYPPFEN